MLFQVCLRCKIVFISVYKVINKLSSFKCLTLVYSPRCYSSSNSPSLRFFHLHAVRHFAVGTSGRLGNVVVLWRLEARPRGRINFRRLIFPCGREFACRGPQRLFLNAISNENVSKCLFISSEIIPPAEISKHIGKLYGIYHYIERQLTKTTLIWTIRKFVIG